MIKLSATDPVRRNIIFVIGCPENRNHMTSSANCQSSVDRDGTRVQSSSMAISTLNYAPGAKNQSTSTRVVQTDGTVTSEKTSS